MAGSCFPCPRFPDGEGDFFLEARIGFGGSNKLYRFAVLWQTIDSQFEGCLSIILPFFVGAEIRNGNSIAVRGDFHSRIIADTRLDF